jgi:hypothetical protein
VSYVALIWAIFTGTYCGSEEEFVALGLEPAFEGHTMIARTLKKTSYVRFVVDWLENHTFPEELIRVGKGEVHLALCLSLPGTTDHLSTFNSTCLRARQLHLTPRV